VEPGGSEVSKYGLGRRNWIYYLRVSMTRSSSHRPPSTASCLPPTYKAPCLSSSQSQTAVTPTTTTPQLMLALVNSFATSTTPTAVPLASQPTLELLADITSRPLLSLVGGVRSSRRSPHLPVEAPRRARSPLKTSKATSSTLSQSLSVPLGSP